MIPVSKFSAGRAGERVRLVVLHTSEGARTVESLAAFLNRPGVNASYHGAVDDRRYESYVNYSDTAWHLRNGNQEADGLCLCAWARWTRAEWLGHSRMLELTAAWIAQRCTARGLPVARLADGEVGAVMRNRNHRGGVADHDGYSKGTGDGNHSDVGENFPWDVVMARAGQLAGGIADMPLTAEDLARIWDHKLPVREGEDEAWRARDWLTVAHRAATQDLPAQIAGLEQGQREIRDMLTRLLEAHPNP